ncbi:MAG: 50S ribosomal protein L23 [Elusimicrobia bacterium ADurb.Bin231]|nr:MAG: 50S ribosomal protein L23 [Elusimicrobia bacterium ADurb.Bin231]
MNIYNVIKKPIITEKATLLKEKQQKYVFAVEKTANKHQIKQAIEQMFKVDVVGIHTSIVSGKERRMGSKSGFRPDFKKAIVKIKPGQTIKIVEGV